VRLAALHRIRIEFNVHFAVEDELRSGYGSAMKSDTTQLPPFAEMVRAMRDRDRAYEGVFFTAVRTTRIFCRPTCSARKPLPENVEFYATAADALAAGFRPCQRCKPMQIASSAPGWVQQLLATTEGSPERRWLDADLVELGLEPVRVRRWFKQEFGVTFHSYLRNQRLGQALGQLTAGASIDDAAQDIGYESLSGFRGAFQKTFKATPKGSRAMTPLVFTRIATTLGPMIAMAEERGLVLLEFIDRPALPRELDELREKYGYLMVPGKHRHLDQIAAELNEYFAGRLHRFEVPTLTPGSAFEIAVWRELQKVPFGTTACYGDLARRLGKPAAARAIGSANGRNRLSIVIPCHRIIGASGELVGYGGGLPRKQWLLNHERRAVHLRASATEPATETSGLRRGDGVTA
jgi:AraC family transcriptional regulator, regulatory protein of adaptative response / methylated-DNA-[protein]-cysteine methyltransferase